MLLVLVVPVLCNFNCAFSLWCRFCVHLFVLLVLVVPDLRNFNCAFSVGGVGFV